MKTKKLIFESVDNSKPASTKSPSTKSSNSLRSKLASHVIESRILNQLDASLEENQDENNNTPVVVNKRTRASSAVNRIRDLNRSIALSKSNNDSDELPSSSTFVAIL